MKALEVSNYKKHLLKQWKGTEINKPVKINNCFL